MTTTISRLYNNYTDAQRAFQIKDYSTAAKLFYQIILVSQGDVKIKAEFGLAESLRKSGLNYSASYFYSRIVAQGPKNDFFRHSFLHIIRFDLGIKCDFDS